jgi:hypothetical protein
MGTEGAARLRFFCEVCCDRVEIKVVRLEELEVVGLQIWCEEHRYSSITPELVERDDAK